MNKHLGDSENPMDSDPENIEAEREWEQTKTFSCYEVLSVLDNSTVKSRLSSLHAWRDLLWNQVSSPERLCPETKTVPRPAVPQKNCDPNSLIWTPTLYEIASHTAASHMKDLKMESVSNPEPFGPETETVPLDQQYLKKHGP
ncbi:hypothetical protein AVEN_59237-1 [Araneus ventricosus]|uniref:Uncharacterized protein n=1 Tax=Araneus ventricosus TaxID=182803 RepID=A0A4Y2CZH1_ARAVE|nr:hypothetical protein AVEN_59237-1 [Araneus ventricosus]